MPDSTEPRMQTIVDTQRFMAEQARDHYPSALLVIVEWWQTRPQWSELSVDEQEMWLDCVRGIENA